MRRFISADNLIAEVGSTVQGHNLYVYSFSNPVNMADDTGNWPTLSQIYAGIAIAGAVVATGALLVAAAPVAVGGAVALSATALIVAEGAMIVAGVYGSAAIIANAFEEGYVSLPQVGQITFSKTEKRVNEDDGLDDESPRRERVGKQKGKAPRSNKAQNRDFDYVKKELGLSSKEAEELHREISNRGYSKQDIFNAARDLFGNR